MSVAATQAKVKGLAFRSVIHALERLEGKDTVLRAAALMPVELGQRVRTAAIVSSVWYPLSEYAAMWNAIQQTTGERRELPRIVGQRCIEHDLNVVHKLFMRALNVSTVVSLAMRLFNNYYDTGKALGEQIGERRTRVVFTGCAGFTVPMWQEARGACEGFVVQAARTRVGSTFKLGGSVTGPDATLEVWWDAASDTD